MKFLDMKNNHSFDTNLEISHLRLVKSRIEAVKRIQEDNDCSWSWAKRMYEDVKK